MQNIHISEFKMFLKVQDGYHTCCSFPFLRFFKSIQLFYLQYAQISKYICQFVILIDYLIENFSLIYLQLYINKY